MPYGSTTSQDDCMVTVPFGEVGTNGIVFSGTTQSIPVVPSWPFYSLRPIPNQSMLITYSSAPIVGAYMHFYISIRDKMPSIPQYINGRWQYTITGSPDFSLKDNQGNLLVTNPSVMGFSPNGSWMVVDLPWQGLVRVNLATFQILPFAPSLQQGNDYSNQRAQLAISNDGKQVVIKPNSFDNFKVYDLTSCSSDTSMPVAAGSTRCATRDYWNDVTSQISGFKALYQPRFVNDTQISFTALYDYNPGDFKAATYTMTAPGISPSGIEYLGMGDSYASGEGAYAYVDGTDTSNNACHLSTKSYAYILSEQLFSSRHAVSCSGAVTNDIVDTSLSYHGQVHDKIVKGDRDRSFINSILATYTPGFLAQTEFVDKYKPDAITLSIGGNNIGFADIIKSCVTPITLHSSCYSTYEDRLELDNHINNVFDTLVSTYKAIARPGKRVYVIGYPQIAASGGDCALNVHLDDSEIQFANDLVDYLDQTISRAADKAGVRYVDVKDVFNGHRLCETKSSDIAVNGLTAGNDKGVGPLKFLGNESYHPNVLGHELYAQAIRAKTNNLRLAMPATNAALQAPPLPASLDASDLLKSGRQVNQLVTSDSLVPDLIVRGQDFAISLGDSTATLKPATAYKVAIGNNAAGFATFTTDQNGNLSGNFQIPTETQSGFQKLHVYGPNLFGQPLDITKTVYIAATSTDYNGDGVANDIDPCALILASHVDVDKDGIDDACDPLIGDAPPQKLSHLSSSVTLTGNSMTITISPP